MKGYWGSVRFFKNLILLLVIIFIAVPTCFSCAYRAENARLEKSIAQHEQSEDELRRQASDLLDQVKTLEEEAEARHIDPDGPEYQQLYPDFYAPQAVVPRKEQEKVIYLTFDDGPSDRTPEVLQILKEEDVKATFFVIGGNNDLAQQRMRQIVDAGHTIAMHSYSHNYDKIYESVEAYLKDMYKVFKNIKEATGVTPTHFRFPGGSINGYNYDISQEIISEMLRRGFIPYDWNISSGDASTNGSTAAAITRRVVNGAEGVSWGVVLMHDSGYKYTTVEALRPMIRQLREMGFTFDALQIDTPAMLFDYAY